VCSTSVNNRSARRHRGFTLIELLLVVSIIGILVAVGLANFVSLQKRARYASCISNQHHAHEAGILYASETLVGTQNINISVLTGSGLITQEVGECPSSGTVDFDDYNLSYVNNDLTAITCSILGAEHAYVP
jgi:prepilin-type N-terminal cleavage/methylation domain-containing protein